MALLETPQGLVVVQKNTVGRAKGKPQVGNIEQLGDHVHLRNKKHQGEGHICTAWAIGEHVSVNWGKQAHLLVTRLQEPMLTEPDPPRGDAGRALAERHRAQLCVPHKGRNAHCDDKAKQFGAFRIVCDQFSVESNRHLQRKRLVSRARN